MIEVWTHLASQVDRARAVAGLTDNQVALLRQDLLKIHALDGFVVRDNNTCWHSTILRETRLSNQTGAPHNLLSTCLYL